MRGLIAIGLGALLLLLATQGAMAQDAEQSATDRLLEILKERQIISPDEYGELKGLADKMQEENSELDRRLGTLDRSISDYLAKGGDQGARANVAYNKGSGFRLYTNDGLFELNIGGDFLFTYTFNDTDRRDDDRRVDASIRSADSIPSHPLVPYSGVRWGKDTNDFDVQELRLILSGHAFMPELTFWFELNCAPEISDDSSDSYDSQYYPGSNKTFNSYNPYPNDDEGVELLDAWVNYDYCGWVEVQFGQFKAPAGRQWLTHQGDLAFPDRSVTAQMMASHGRDVGVMVHDMRAVGDKKMVEDNTAFAYEYSFGVFNGEGKDSSYNDSNRPAWSGRLAFYPMGYVPYVEGAWTDDEAPRMGFGMWMGRHKAAARDLGPFTSERIQNTLFDWGLDAVMVWDRLFLLGEFTKRKVKTERRGSASPTGHYNWRGKSWYAQAGFMIIKNELEVLARYSRSTFDYLKDLSFSEMSSSSGTPYYVNRSSEYSVGLAYYIDKSDLKVTLDAGRTNVRFKYADDLDYTFLRLAFWLSW